MYNMYTLPPFVDEVKVRMHIILCMYINCYVYTQILTSFDHILIALLIYYVYNTDADMYAILIIGGL